MLIREERRREEKRGREGERKEEKDREKGKIHTLHILLRRGHISKTHASQGQHHSESLAKWWGGSGLGRNDLKRVRKREGIKKRKEKKRKEKKRKEKKKKKRKKKKKKKKRKKEERKTNWLGTRPSGNHNRLLFHNFNIMNVFKPMFCQKIL